VSSVTAAFIHRLLSFESEFYLWLKHMQLVKVCPVPKRGRRKTCRYMVRYTSVGRCTLGIRQTGLLSWVIVGAVGLSPITVFFIARVISEVFRRRRGERPRVGGSAGEGVRHHVSGLKGFPQKR
jgi:hypothetical protein